MARYKLQGRARDTWGNTISGLDIYIYVAGTSKLQDAIIYISSTSTTAISASPQISSDQYGSFQFWVDDTDYTASTTKFDIYADGLDYTYVDIFNIKHHGTLGDLLDNDHPQYAEHINVSTVTVETTASNADVILADASGGAFTVYLQESDDASITVKKIDLSNNVTVRGLSGNIDGASTKVLNTQYERNTFAWDGNNWFII